MTTRETTGLLRLQSDHFEAGIPHWKRLALRLAFGAIQWPWLAMGLHGGSRKRKRQLLERLELPDDALPNLGSWKADTELLHLLVDAIENGRPQQVVELGSGATSLVIAKALARNGGGKLLSYDQHAGFVGEMPEWLGRHGLDAQFIHAPLSDDLPGRPGPWYKLSGLPETIDILMIDGPPWAVHALIRGRAEVLFDRIAPGGMVLMDDANRPGERIVARNWRRNWPDFEFVRVSKGAKGTLVGRRIG